MDSTYEDPFLTKNPNNINMKMCKKYKYLFDPNILNDMFKNDHLHKCFLCNNVFAFKYQSGDDCISEMKYTNYVPTYDKICLCCGEEGVKSKCSKCRSVYFCNKECQKLCWNIHKKHCGRNIFALCATCGNNQPKIKCDKCPVMFCNELCKSQIITNHKIFDCDKFAKLFGNHYLLFSSGTCL